MTFTPIGHEQAQAYRVALALKKAYSYWTADTKGGIPYLTWSDEGARDAYRMICMVNRIPVEG